MTRKAPTTCPPHPPPPLLRLTWVGPYLPTVGVLILTPPSKKRPSAIVGGHRIPASSRPTRETVLSWRHVLRLLQSGTDVFVVDKAHLPPACRVMAQGGGGELGVPGVSGIGGGDRREPSRRRASLGTSVVAAVGVGGKMRSTTDNRGGTNGCCCGINSWAFGERTLSIFRDVRVLSSLAPRSLASGATVVRYAAVEHQGQVTRVRARRRLATWCQFCGGERGIGRITA